MARAQKPAKARMGRPPKGGQRYTVRLTPQVAERLRELGEGNLTLGIERAAERAGPKSGNYILEKSEPV